MKKVLYCELCGAKLVKDLREFKYDTSSGKKIFPLSCPNGLLVYERIKETGKVRILEYQRKNAEAGFLRSFLPRPTYPDPKRWYGGHMVGIYK